jgi:hypothetical protein
MRRSPRRAAGSGVSRACRGGVPARAPATGDHRPLVSITKMVATFRALNPAVEYRESVIHGRTRKSPWLNEAISRVYRWLPLEHLEGVWQSHMHRCEMSHPFLTLETGRAEGGNVSANAPTRRPCRHHGLRRAQRQWQFVRAWPARPAPRASGQGVSTVDIARGAVARGAAAWLPSWRSPCWSVEPSPPRSSRRTAPMSSSTLPSRRLPAPRRAGPPTRLRDDRKRREPYQEIGNGASNEQTPGDGSWNIAHLERAGARGLRA